MTASMEVDGPSSSRGDTCPNRGKDDTGSSRGVTEPTNEKDVAGTSISDADRK